MDEPKVFQWANIAHTFALKVLHSTAGAALEACVVLCSMTCSRCKSRKLDSSCKLFFGFGWRTAPELRQASTVFTHRDLASVGKFDGKCIAGHQGNTVCSGSM